MTHATLVSAAEKIGFYLKRVQLGNRMETRWACKCSRCNTERVWGWEPATGTAFMHKNLVSAKWSYDKRGPICDDCTKKEHQEARKKVTKLEPISNPKLQRKVFALLDDHFNENTRLYDNGWSDRKVADEAQTSEQFVESLRRGAYGELAEDPAVTALRREIDALSDEAKQSADTLMSIYGDLEKKVSDLRSRVENLAVKRRAG